MQEGTSPGEERIFAAELIAALSIGDGADDLQETVPPTPEELTALWALKTKGAS